MSNDDPPAALVRTRLRDVRREFVELRVVLALQEEGHHHLPGLVPVLVHLREEFLFPAATMCEGALV